MATLDPERFGPPERIFGERVDLNVFNPQSIQDRLTQDGSYYKALNNSTADDLPRPLNSTRIDAFKHTHEGARHELSASIAFEPPHTKAEEWMDLLELEIQSRYSFTLPDAFVHVPHEQTAFYARLSNDTYARIEFSSHINECRVHISLQDRSELEEVTESSIEIVDEPVELTALARFKDFSRVWLASLDSVVSLFGNKDSQKYMLDVGVSEYSEASDTTEPDEQTPEPAQETERMYVNAMGLVGGMTHAKSVLSQSVEIIRDKDRMNLYGIRAPHFILHGPPGTGKTSLLHAFAHENNASLYHIDSTDIIGKYIGESAKAIVDEFEEAKKLTEIGPVVIILDEIETLIRTSGRPHHEVLNVIKMLNKLIDDVSEDFPNRIIVAGATNEDPSNLDPSVTRSGRLELIPIHAPDPTERVGIWWRLLAKKFLDFNRINLTPTETEKLIDQQELFAPFSNDVNPTKLSAHTDGMVGADFTNAIQRALSEAAKHDLATGGGIMVTQDMLEKAITDIRRNR